MNKNLLAFISKMEHRFGTKKFRLCLGIALLNFIALALALEDNPELPEPQNNENNKEEK